MNSFLRVLIGAALAALALTSSASAAEKSSKLVVRGVDTVIDGPCPAGVCQLTLTDGAFRGTTGTGAYSGSIKLAVKSGFPNGEGGVCAPIEGEITLGTGTPNRLVLALAGDSCQDGAGDVTQASFTGVAHFVVKHGTGTYAKTRGYGIATFSEGVDDRERMTLIGRTWR